MTTTLADEILTCPTPESLRQYLSGWLTDEQSREVEQHAGDCSACQQILRDSELLPDTLLQSLQNTVDTSRRTTNPGAAGSEPAGTAHPIDAAIERVRQLAETRPADAQRNEWRPAQQDVGAYELQRPLGRGGMGAVYLAVHRQLRKQVAIKLLPVMSAEDSDVRARFAREIRVIGKLNHPSIVTATDAGEVDGTQFLVMEYVAGLDLSRLARIVGCFSIPDACELIRQTALGLSCAHAEGVVHRDVKPSNLMLDESGRIRILDFGLAQLNVWDEVSVDLTTVGQLMGTLDYMAPEQAEVSGGVDYRADLYALGATLFRLLCGRPPLAAAPNQSPLEKLRLLANHQPPKLSTLCPGAPEELVALVGSLLARNPQQRPASAAHVAEQLAPFAAGAKLVELLQSAKDRVVESPELLKRTAAGEPPGLPALAHAPSESSVADSSRGRSRTVRRLVVASLLPLVIIAGFFIKLELNKGQLVIESEADNVSIKLLRNGKPVDGIQVTHGTTSTRLHADHYEIMIDGPSDNLVIDNNQFTLKSGETVVARIRSELATAGPSKESTVTDMDDITDDSAETLLKLRREQLEQKKARQRTDSANSDGPLYEGKPLEHWLDMLSREKSAAGLKAAFDACDALLTTENSRRIADVLLDVVPSLDGDMNLSSDPSRVLSVDSVAPELLRQALPGADYSRQWIAEFEIGDAEWKQRLWQSYAQDASNVTVDEVEPFFAWVADRLSRPLETGQATDRDMILAGDRLRLLTGRYSAIQDEASIERVARILVSSPQLNDAWWLSQPLLYGNADRRQHVWSALIEAEITQRAVRVFTAEDSPATLAVQACMILSDRPELDAASQSAVLSAVQRRLRGACSSKAEFTQIVQTLDSFSNSFLPMLDNESPIRAADIQMEFRSSMVGHIPMMDHSVMLQLLHLVSTLPDPDQRQVESELTAVVAHAAETLQILNAARQKSEPTAESRRGGFGRRPNNVRISLLWPDLTVSSGSADILGSGGGGRGGFGGYPAAGDIRPVLSLVWGSHEPTKEDWLTYLILLHPAMRPGVTEALARLDAQSQPTDAAPEAPGESTDQPAIKN